MLITGEGNEMNREELNNQITSLEKRVANQVDKLEKTFLQQIGQVRELLQALNYKRALLKHIKDTGSLHTK